MDRTPRSAAIRPTFAPSTLVQLYSKKKKAAPAATKKIQVKMLKAVAGTGQKGDVVLVTPAFFNNKLRPTQSASIISDEEVEQEQAERATAEQERTAQANAIKEYVEGNQPLKLTQKAGPDGQLFGAIHAKTVLEAVSKQLSEDDAAFLEQKSIKIALLDGEGKKMRGDIKHVGEFQANIALTKNISAKLDIVVEAEE